MRRGARPSRSTVRWTASSPSFTASGSPDRVGLFLAQVCAALREPPLERLAQEAKVLAAEDQSQHSDAGAALHRARYGYQDLGILDAPRPRATDISGAVITEYAQRCFVTGNCFLIIDGPAPAGLSLKLRPGTGPARDWPAPRSHGKPSVTVVDSPACAVSFLLAAAGSDGIRQVATSIIVNRLTESLRHQAGLTYVIDHDLEPVHGERFDLVVYAEPPAESVIDAVRLMITTVTAMLAHGPDEAEFVEAVDKERERHRGRQAMIDEIGTRALDQLLARSQGSAEVDPLSAITRDQLTSYLRGLSNDVLYLADIRSEDVLVELGVPLATRSEVMTKTLPAGTVYRPPLLARAISAEARGARVIVSDDGLSLVVDGEVQQLAFADIVGAARGDDGDLVVFGRDGSAIPVGPELYCRADRLVETITSRVPSHLIYRSPDLTNLDG
jgi:hypothetical protein